MAHSPVLLQKLSPKAGEQLSWSPVEVGMLSGATPKDRRGPIAPHGVGWVLRSNYIADQLLSLSSLPSPLPFTRVILRVFPYTPPVLMIISKTVHQQTQHKTQRSWNRVRFWPWSRWGRPAVKPCTSWISPLRRSLHALVFCMGTYSNPFIV